MSFSDNIAGEITEQIAGLGGHVVKQTKKAASDIVKGVVTGGLSNQSQGDLGSETLSGNASNSQMPSDAKKKAYSSTAMNDQKRLAQIRQNLKAYMTPNKPAKQEVPAYISGKPGGSQDEMQKKQMEMDKKKNELPPLPISAKAGRGTGETHRGVAG